MDRRDLLHPRQAARAVGHLLGAAGELSASSPAPTPDEVALLRLGWRAMATQWDIQAPFDTPGAVEAAQDAFALLDALEDQLTVYRDHSAVCRLNRNAPSRPVRVEGGLFDLLRLARRLHDETEGTFDVTAGALIKAWGFFRGPRRVPSPDELSAARRCVGMRHVRLDEEARTVRYGVAGLEINLGGIGKGHALDRLAERLTARHGWNRMLIHGGHSSLIARGDLHGDGRGWPVSVRHPLDLDRRLALVNLRDQAMGTSAATFQHLEYQGRRLGHVLDPRTGWPASGVASATVVGPSAAEADALSTAFFVGGLDLAQRVCRRRPEIGAIILPEDEDEPVRLGTLSGTTT